MAQDALKIVLESNTGTKDVLAEQYGTVFDNLSHSTISMQYKNQDIVSGDAVKGGILNFRRYANSTLQPYGTARTANKGNGLQSQPISININDDKELMEEIEEKDLRLSGFNDLVIKRALNQEDSMRIYTEQKFFNTGVLAGTVHTLVGSAIDTKLEEIIQLVETCKNNFVNGVTRNNIVLVLRPATYGLARNYIDTVSNPNINSAIGEFGMFHGVMVHSSIYLPDTVDYFVMAKGSIGQPIIQNVREPFVPQYADAISFGMYLYMGHGAVMPDLIFFAGTLGTATLTTVYGGASNKTTITPTNTKSAPANTFWYKADASAITAPVYGANAATAGYTEMTLTDGAQTLTVATEAKIRVAECDDSGRIIKVSADTAIVKTGG